MSVIRLILVEDEPLWQQAIAALLESESQLALLATVDNAADALSAIKDHDPQVLLLDWKIKGAVDGLELANMLIPGYEPSQIIMITGSPAEQLGQHPFRYVPKPSIAEALVPEIQKAVAELDTLPE